MGSLTDAPEHAQELAQALARVAADPDRTRHLHTILGHFCHQLRNDLNSLKISLYLAKRRKDSSTQPNWTAVEPRYQVVEHFVERLQQICRPLPINPIPLCLGLLVQEHVPAWSEMLATHGRALRVEAPDISTIVSFDPCRLGSALDNLVAWRARAGDPSTDLRVCWGPVAGGGVQLVWDEIPSCDFPNRSGLNTADGRSEDSSSHVEAFPDCPSCIEVEDTSLEALTLPLLSRIMSLHGGSVESYGEDPWRLVIRWPHEVPTS